jgi:hypothetical protein
VERANLEYATWNINQLTFWQSTAGISTSVSPHPLRKKHRSRNACG